MAKGIVLLLDAGGAGAIRACWRRLEAAGIPSLESFTHRRHEPHISLVVAEEIEIGDWLGVLREGFFPADPLCIELAAVDGFPGGWVYLAVTGLPAPSHSQLVTALGRDAAGIWEHYLPQNWIPHCTLAGDLSEPQVAAAIELIRSRPPPATATIVTAALIDSETGDVRVLHEHAAATAST